MRQKMQIIDISTLDKNLIADINGDTAGWTAFKAEADYDGTTVSNQCYHIAFNETERRGGIVFVGSGSSGVTSWTDAATADEVLARYLADDMIE